MKYSNEKSKSALLVNLIGIPNVRKPNLSQLKTENITSFLKLAEKNKIPLLFLREVASKIERDSIRTTLLQYEEKYEKSLDLTKFVASLLKNSGVHYTFFKTLKPFPYVPSDVDVLFWTNNDLKKAVRTLTGEGCIVLNRDAYGVTMFSPLHNMNIDLTTQIAVSGLIYVNKKLLVDQVNELEFYGTMVRTLSSPADLVVVTAHSIFKEQMFILSDYYFLVMFKQYWEESSELAKKLHLSHALKTMLKMTGAVTLDAFGSLTSLTEEFKTLGITHMGISCKKNIRLPKKYNLGTIMVEFLKKLTTDPSTMNSLPSVARSLCNPAFYLKTLEHATRKRY